MFEIRLGDVIDDHCIKCRRITNHSVVSIVDGAAAKVRCRTCYHDHDYRHEQPPPSKKELKKQELFREVLATLSPGAAAEEPAADPAPAESTAGPTEEPPQEAPAPESPKRRTRAQKS